MNRLNFYPSLMKLSMLSTRDFDFSREKMIDLRVAIDELMALKTELRHYAPNFHIEERNEKQKVIKRLEKAGKKLVPIFKELHLCEDVSKETILKMMGKTKGGSAEASKAEKEKEVAKGKTSAKSEKEEVVVESEIDLLDVIGDDYVFVGSNTIRDK